MGIGGGAGERQGCFAARTSYNGVHPSDDVRETGQNVHDKMG